MDNQPPPAPDYQPAGPQPAQLPINKKSHGLLFGCIALIVLVAGVGGTYAWQHGKVTSLSRQVNSLNAQVGSLKKQASAQSSQSQAKAETNAKVYARNTDRQVDIQALQTQLEAFFSQNGFYPSLTDMNSATWRATNMKSLDPTTLVDPSSTCDPATASCLVAAPAAKHYAYKVSDSKGASCESADTSCAQYTLTATYEGAVGNSTIYVKNNLD